MRAHPTREHLDWPFFEPAHRAYAERLDRFVAGGAIDDVDHRDIDGACRKLVARLGEAGLLDIAVVDATGDPRSILSRLVCLTRETLAWHDGLADFAFAMQGLGAGAIGLAGSPELQAAVLPMVRAGKWVAAFALSEKEAGSDVAAMSCAARADGDRLYSRRRKDVDFQRRNRRRLYRLRAHRRSAGHARNLGLRRLPRRSRVFDRRADRSHRAASARDDPLRRLPNSG